MIIALTDRQQQLLDIANNLAQKFAARAPQHDRDGSFPHENYADAKAAGLPGFIVPEEFGGWGMNLLDATLLMEALGAGDGSTALSLTMHVQTLGSAAEKRSWPEDLFARICRDAVERGALINAIATEPKLGSPSRGGKPETTATPVYGSLNGSARNGSAPKPNGEPTEWIISGRKSFASMIPALDYAIIPALLLDGSDEVARFVVPVDETIEIIETWDAMGMRTTGSHDIVLHDTHAPNANLLGRGDGAKSASSGPSTVNAWFMLTISAVYVGVANAALRTAAEFANERVPTALGKPIATLENIQRRLGEADLLLRQARTMLYSAAEQWSLHPEHRVDLGPQVIAAKVTATNNAIQATDHAMRVVGGVGLSRSMPMERFYRDVRAGLNHPVNDDQALVMFGKNVTEAAQGVEGGEMVEKEEAEQELIAAD